MWGGAVLRGRPTGMPGHSGVASRSGRGWFWLLGGRLWGADRTDGRISDLLRVRRNGREDDAARWVVPAGAAVLRPVSIVWSRMMTVDMLAGRARAGRAVILAALAALLLPLLAVPGAMPARAATCAASAPASSYASGSGTEADPYRISNAAELLRLSDATRSADWDKHFLQTGDIDLAGCTWLPIGRDPDGSGLVRFTGSYDGGGNTVSNLTVTGVSNVGMFGQVAGGSFLDLTLDSPDIEATTGPAAPLIAAHFVGTGGPGLDSLVRGITVIDAKVEAIRSAAGLVGTIVAARPPTSSDGATMTVSDIRVVRPIITGTPTPGQLNRTVAALIGQVGAGDGGTEGTVIISDIVLEDIAVTTAGVSTAAVVGEANIYGHSAVGELRIEDVTMSGTVEGNTRTADTFIGGVVGLTDQDENGTLTIRRVTSSLTVMSAGSWVGGVIGSQQGPSGTLLLEDIVVAGPVSGTEYVGGAIGMDGGSAATTTLDRVHVSAPVVGSGEDVGGLIGQVTAFFGTSGTDREHDLTIRGSSVTGDVSGVDRVGGLVGSLTPGDGVVLVEDTSVSGAVTASAAEDGVSGGLAVVEVTGQTPVVLRDVVIDSAITVTVVGSSAAVGGVVGSADGALTMQRVAASGSIDAGGTGSDVVRAAGGLAGLLAPQSAEVRLSEVVSRVVVTGVATHVGGLVAEITGPDLDVEIRDAAATGAVSSSVAGAIVGGAIGNVDATVPAAGSFTMTDSYAAAEVTASGAGSIVGGLIAQTVGGVSARRIIESFWDRQVVGVLVSDGGVSRTTQQLQELATFSGADWDISSTGVGTVWVTCDGSYPELMWTDEGVLLAALCNPPSVAVGAAEVGPDGTLAFTFGNVAYGFFCYFIGDATAAERCSIEPQDGERVVAWQDLHDEFGTATVTVRAYIPACTVVAGTTLCDADRSAWPDRSMTDTMVAEATFAVLAPAAPPATSPEQPPAEGGPIPTVVPSGEGPREPWSALLVLAAALAGSMVFERRRGTFAR